MKRERLREIIEAACSSARIEGEPRERLIATADKIDQIATGAFCVKGDDGTICGCPATVAGYFDPTNSTWSPDIGDAAVYQFPSYFDDLMLHEPGARPPLHESPEGVIIKVED